MISYVKRYFDLPQPVAPGSWARPTTLYACLCTSEQTAAPTPERWPTFGTPRYTLVTPLFVSNAGQEINLCAIGQGPRRPTALSKRSLDCERQVGFWSGLCGNITSQPRLSPVPASTGLRSMANAPRTISDPCWHNFKQCGFSVFRGTIPL
jgi:hypothetical protein